MLPEQSLMRFHQPLIMSANQLPGQLVVTQIITIGIKCFNYNIALRVPCLRIYAYYILHHMGLAYVARAEPNDIPPAPDHEWMHHCRMP